MSAESPSTGELQHILTNTHSEKGLSSYLEQHTVPDSDLSFSSVFQTLLEQYHPEKSKSDIIQASNLERTYAYQLLNGTRRPGRDKVLALGIAAGFSLKEIRKLLESAGAAILYSRSSRDAVIIYGIEHRLGLMRINEMLEEIGEKAIE